MRAPWRLKVAGKLLLSRLPIGYEHWRSLSLFRHGAMDDPAYALSVFDRHYPHAGTAMSPGFVALELGPGDSVAAAMIASAYGAAHSWLVDVGSFARRDMAPYRELGRKLRARALPTPDVDSIDTIEDLLEACQGIYLTEGLASLRTIPDAAVDFAWSHAVLEHVDRSLFVETMDELHRVIRPGGLASHRIDFEDHLEGSLNHLRFTTLRWESPAFKHSGFYTNRLTCDEIVRACRDAGFETDVVGIERWDQLPIPRGELAPPFRDLPEEGLRIRAVDLVTRRAPDQGLKGTE